MLVATKFEVVESGLKFAACMTVAGTGGDGDSLVVQGAGVVNLSKFFKRLAAMEVSSGVVRIVLEKLAKLGHGFLKSAGVQVLHGEAIADKSVGWIALQHLFQRVDSSGTHVFEFTT